MDEAATLIKNSISQQIQGIAAAAIGVEGFLFEVSAVGPVGSPRQISKARIAGLALQWTPPMLTPSMTGL